MRGVRVRWARAGKAAAIAIAGLVALQALPGLLKPPAPPPLEADVGLPRVVPKEPAPVRRRRGRQAVGPAIVVAKPAAPAHPPKPPSPSSPSTPEPAAYVPPPPPAPAAPSPPPAVVDDGSEEFAPH
ncbi:MAG: hypothetical protein ACTHN7_07190 [Solirubrobacterales bacterium]